MKNMTHKLKLLLQTRFFDIIYQRFKYGDFKYDYFNNKINTSRRR